MPKQKKTINLREVCTVLVEVGLVPRDKTKFIPLEVCGECGMYPAVLARRNVVKKALGGNSAGIVKGLRLLCEPVESRRRKYPVARRAILADATI
jgi:hypothetical protein